MQNLINALTAKGARPVFLTGAGVSLASGIPTFRGPDPDAVWAHDVLEKATLEFFHRHPNESWQWYLERFAVTLEAKPNPAHIALASLGGLIPSTFVVTQNVDGLHFKAGQSRLAEVHGTARHLRCTNRNCKFGPPKGLLDWDEALVSGFRENPSLKTVPRCPACRKLLRPHVLWFDESYSGHDAYQIDRVLKEFEDMTVLVCVGTSFSVTITSMAIRAAGYRVPVFIIDPHMQTTSDPEHTLYREPAEDFLPQVAKAASVRHTAVV